MINSIEDMLADLGVTSFAAFEKAVYKGTDCGAWICRIAGLNHGDPDGLQVGSIVEGSDACATPITLYYPFEASEFWDACEAVNKEACALWDACHDEHEF